jgi:hypothetical protein
MRPLLPPEKPRTGCPAKNYCVVVNGWKDLIYVAMIRLMLTAGCDDAAPGIVDA